METRALLLLETWVVVELYVLSLQTLIAWIVGVVKKRIQDESKGKL
jgi:hypothetical protein